MKRVSYKKGMIILDILLALTLTTVFIIAIAEISHSAHQAFAYSQDKEEILDMYELGQATSSQREYGNDRIEIQSSVFSEIQVRQPYTPFLFDAAGTPLCVVDFVHPRNSVFSTTTSDSAHVQAYSLPISSLIPLTDIEVRNTLAYIGADSNTISDPDIFVVDISQPERLFTRSSLHTGPGIAAFALAGKRIFAAVTSAAAQLHILRLDTPDSLTLEKKFTLTLPSSTTPPTVGSAIFYDRNKIYLGTEKWDGEELIIFDVSNPASPVKIGALEIGSKVNDVYVHDDMAYIASSDQNEFRVVNVHNPSQPVILATFTPSGWERQEGNALSYFEHRVSLGRTSGGFNIAADHEIFSWASTSAQNLTSPVSSDLAGGIYGIVTDRSQTFLATRQLGQEFQIRSHDLSSTSKKTISLPSYPQTMTCDMDKMYILSHTAPVIYKVEFY